MMVMIGGHLKDGGRLVMVVILEGNLMVIGDHLVRTVDLGIIMVMIGDHLQEGVGLEGRTAGDRRDVTVIRGKGAGTEIQVGVGQVGGHTILEIGVGQVLIVVRVVLHQGPVTVITGGGGGGHIKKGDPERIEVHPCIHHVEGIVIGMKEVGNIVVDHHPQTIAVQSRMRTDITGKCQLKCLR